MSTVSNKGASAVRPKILGPVLFGIAAIFAFFGGFGTWAAMAPLDGAVIASGKVAVHGRNKVVQHLEGGIVKEILVEEGQKVSAGDSVMVLDDTAARASLNRLKVQLRTFEAMEARVLAERDEKGSVLFPKSLTEQASTPEVAKSHRGPDGGVPCPSEEAQGGSRHFRAANRRPQGGDSRP